MFKLEVLNENLNSKWIEIYKSYSHFGILDFVLNKLNDQEFIVEGLKFRIINSEGKILNF